MLPADDLPAARRAATGFDDPRIRQFFDPYRQVGSAIAAALGWPDRIAWDVYLFYPSGAVWLDWPPAPAAWLHQLSANWADPSRRCRDDDLVRKLRETMQGFRTGVG